MSNFGRMGLKSHIVRTKRITKLVYISIPTLMLLSGLILNPVTVSHEEASAATGTATAATTSLTLSSSNNSANVAITPKSANGTFAMSSAAGEAQFGVTTNNFTGYELSIVADDDSGNLANTDGNVGHSIFSIDTPITKDSFDTTTYNNRWGYKPNKYVANNTVIDNTGDSAVFLPSPTTTGTILDHTTVANSSANNYSIALGVRADYNTYSGSYAKAFKLQVTANPASYTINFNKNTADAVTNMPTTQSSASVSATSIALANNAPSRDSYNFIGWCNAQPTTNNGVDSCPGTTFQPGAAYGIDQTTANITTLYAMWEVNAFTCYKQYRLQNADGSWEPYQSDGSEQIRYGSTCSYSKTLTDYKGSASGANNSTASTSATVTSTTTLSLDLYRNTYALTLSAGDNLKNASITTAAVHGSNYFRWGQRVDLSAAQNDNNTCSTYNTPSWSRTSGVGTLSSSSSTTPYFTMAKGDATVTVQATKTDIKQTITLTRGGTGVNSIRIGSSSYSGSSVSLACGSYEVYGNYKNGYEFQSWAVSGVTLANASSATTTMTVSGPGALTLNGKASGVSFAQAFASAGKTQTNGYYNMQDMTSAICAATRFDETISLRDNRDGEIYQVGKFSDGKCWQMENLRLGDNSTITLTPANTNITSNYTLPANLRLTSDPFYSYTEPQIDTNSKTLALSAPGASGTAIVGVYYNFCALSAGTICEENNGNELTQDICPKGWRVPTGSTSGEYAKLYNALGYANFLSILRFPFAGTAWGRGITEDDEVQIWTATPTSTLINRYFLNIVRTASGYQVKNNVSISRQEGKPIRCIAK